MRKILFSLLLLFLPATAAAQVAVRVELPGFLRPITGPKTRVAIVVPPPFYVRLVVDVGEVPGCFGPGTTLYDERGFEFPTAELAVAARVYLDAGCEYQVGLAGTVLQVRAGELSSWQISNVCRLDGGWLGGGYGYGWGSPYPTAAQGEVVRFPLPRPSLETETTVQVLNCSLLPARVALWDPSGPRVVNLRAGEVALYRASPRYERAILEVQVDFEDGRGGARGTWRSGQFWVNQNVGRGPQARQFVVRASDARTY